MPEFIDRHEGDLGELPRDSHPEAQNRRRKPGASSINPPGQSPGRNPIGRPDGTWFSKMIYPYPTGMPGENTGIVPPTPVDAETGLPVYDEKHPMPVMLTRAAIDYFVNTIRQMQVHVQKPGWMEPPFFAKCIDMFSPQGGVSLAIGAAFTSVVQGPFTMPGGNVGVIWFLGQELNDPAGFDFVTWRILKNGRPEECWHNIGIQLGNIAFSNGKLPVPVHLQPGDTIDFQANNSAGAPTGYTAYGRIAGWYFPAEIVDNSFRSRVVN